MGTTQSFVHNRVFETFFLTFSQFGIAGHHTPNCSGILHDASNSASTTTIVPLENIIIIQWYP